MTLNNWIVITVVAVLAVTTIIAKKLTVPASLSGFTIALVIYFGVGIAGVWLLAVFFVCGTAATMHGIKTKQSLGLAESNKGKRTTGQVFANAGVPACLSLIALAYPAQSILMQFMVAGAFAAATADTLSSELGNLYGKHYYNIFTLKQDKRGLDGVISLQGTLAGIAGSILITVVFIMFHGFNNNVPGIFVGGVAGNLVDSYLGATWERKGFIGNNAVNFLNTLTGALIAFLFIQT